MLTLPRNWGARTQTISVLGLRRRHHLHHPGPRGRLHLRSDRAELGDDPAARRDPGRATCSCRSPATPAGTPPRSPNSRSTADRSARSPTPYAPGTAHRSMKITRGRAKAGRPALMNSPMFADAPGAARAASGHRSRHYRGPRTRRRRVRCRARGHHTRRLGAVHRVPGRHRVRRATNGTVLPVDYDFGTLQSEATGRQAVELIGQGQYVSFTLTTAANAVDFHYAIPDSLGRRRHHRAAGPVRRQHPDHRALADLAVLLAVRPYAGSTVINTPSVGDGADTEVPHDFYNDVRYQFSSTLPAGTVVKLQVDCGRQRALVRDQHRRLLHRRRADRRARPAYINVTASPYNADDTGVNDSTRRSRTRSTPPSPPGRRRLPAAGHIQDQLAAEREQRDDRGRRASGTPP